MQSSALSGPDESTFRRVLTWSVTWSLTWSVGDQFSVFSFQFSVFSFWILDFGFWILDFGFWILDFGFCAGGAVKGVRAVAGSRPLQSS